MEPFSLQNVNILEYPKSWFENPMCAKNAMKVNFMIYLYAIAKDILQWEPISNLKQPSNEKKIHVLACNDVIIRNKILTRALRFSLMINHKIVDKEIIGDGIVLSSP